MFKENKNVSEVPVDEKIDELLLNDDVRNFIYKNDLSHEAVVSALNVFMYYISDSFINEEGLRESRSVPGFRLTLNMVEGNVRSGYERIKKIPKYYSLIKTINFPMDLRTTSFADFQLTSDERIEAYQYARRFINSFNEEDQMKGMYISGNFRSGKTYLASAVANEIAKKGFNVVEVYYPELSSLLKGTINNDGENNFQKIIDELKSTDFLVLDDFGGEALNTFIRDEALGVILNYRMEKKKPIFITSNIPVSKLMNACLRKDGSEQEAIKAQRIYKRIEETTTEFMINDKFVENKYNDLF